MGSLKQLTLIICLVFSAPLCWGRLHNPVVDSIDKRTHERIVIAEYKIRNPEHRKLSSLFIEKKGDKYYIVFPFFMYTPPPYGTRSDNKMPKGTPVYIRLKNQEIVRSKTGRDTEYFLHYLWRYTAYQDTHLGLESLDGFGSTNLVVYTWREHSQIPYDISNINGYFDDYFGMDWMLTFELTAADMAMLSRSEIVDAHCRKDDQIMIINLKHSESKKIQKMIASLLRK